MNDERSPAVRLSDHERQVAIDALTRHGIEGRLTLYETEERITAAVQARTRAELVPLLADLPVLPTGRDGRPLPPAAPRRPGDGARLALRLHLAIYAVVIAFLVLIWVLTSFGGYFWPIWPALGWGVGLAIHALVTRALTNP